MKYFSKGIADRIRIRLEELGLSAASLSKKAGLAHDAIRNILQGRTSSPRITTLESLAIVLEIDPYYLITGKEPMGLNSRYILVEYYKTDKNPSLEMQTNKTNQPVIAFSRDWLNKKGLLYQDLSILTVQEDSMEPVFKTGDLVLINHAEKEILDSKVYAFKAQDKIYIKKLEKIPNHSVLVSSYNQTYDSYQLDLSLFKDKKNDFKVLGKIISSVNFW